MAELITTLIPYGVVALQIAGVVLLLALIFARSGALVKWVGGNALVLGFLVTLASVAGSLFYSNVVGFEPCLLCWWQRIFMYPQLILFSVALWNQRIRKPGFRIETGFLEIFRYSLALSVIGGLIAIYHILLPSLAQWGVECVTTGVSCAKLYVFAFGYITIPVMSLTVFAVLVLLGISVNVKQYEK